MNHLAVEAMLGSREVKRFKAIVQRRDDRRGDRSLQLLSLSSRGYLYHRTIENDRQQASESNLSRCLAVEQDDLVVNPMWITGGSLAVSRLNGAVSPDYRVFRIRSSEDPRFIHHLLRSNAYLDQYRLYARAETTFDRRIQQADLDELPIPAVPLAQQRRIADFLDDQVARIDNIVAAREKQKSALSKSSLVTLVHVALEDGADGSSPLAWFPAWRDGWQTWKLAWLARCLDGRRVPLNATERANRPGPYPYYGASTLVDYVDGYLFDGDFVLIGEDGASLENPDFDVVQRVSGRFWVNNHAHVLEAAHVDLDYLAAYLRCVDRFELISGATRAKITQEDLMRIPVIVPGEAEQRRLSEMCRVRLNEVAFALGGLARGIELLHELKRSLIAAAVTGEFDVSSADGSRVPV